MPAKLKAVPRSSPWPEVAITTSDVAERVSAFGSMLESLQRRYLGYIAVLLRQPLPTADVDDAREVFQRACLSAARKLRNYPQQPYENFEAAFRLGFIRYAVYEFMRGRFRDSPSWMDSIENLQLRDLGVPPAGCRELYIDSQRWLGSLSLENQRLVYLSIENVPAPEIAIRLQDEFGTHISPAAVRKRRSRLLQAARRRFEAGSDD